MLVGAVLVGSYLLGSLPVGLLIARWWAGIDVREHGSRNIGATNVYRVVGRPAGILVFCLDVCKGLAPPLAAWRLGLPEHWQVAAGLAAVLGHTGSPFLRFQGGKGVATSLGVLFGLMWPVAALGWALWAVLVWITGYVSVGSIVACISLFPLAMLFYPHDYARVAFTIGAGALGIFKHRANIRRLLNGTENSFKSPPVPQGVVRLAFAISGAGLVALLVYAILRR